MFNTAMHVGLSDEDLAYVKGRRGTSDDASRCLMVQLASYTHKNLIMESLLRLKHADSQGAPCTGKQTGACTLDLSDSSQVICMDIAYGS